jgi:superfamily II DNA helicase RecQ
MVTERKRNYWRKGDHSENWVVPDEEEIERKVFERKGFIPKAWQIKSIQTMMAGRDVVVISSTGSGKSICYQALAMLVEESGGGVLCISPLKQLMQEQVQNLLNRLTVEGRFGYQSWYQSRLH